MFSVFFSPSTAISGFFLVLDMITSACLLTTKTGRRGVIRLGAGKLRYGLNTQAE